MIKVTANFPKIPKQLFTAEEIRKLCLIAAVDTDAHNQQLLDQGKNPDGKKLDEYSESYKARKAATNRDPDKVNLIWSGEMRRSRRTEMINGGARMYFEGGHKGGESNANIARQNEERGREHFGFGEKDIKRIDKHFAAAIDKRMKQILAGGGSGR